MSTTSGYILLFVVTVGIPILIAKFLAAQVRRESNSLPKRRIKHGFDPDFGDTKPEPPVEYCGKCGGRHEI